MIQLQLPLGKKLKTRKPDELVFRSGRRLTYMGGFSTGGGIFQEFTLGPENPPRWITIPHEKFELIQTTGRATFINGGWLD